MLFDKIELETNEVVLKTVRKHWFVIGIELLSAVLFALMPVWIVIALAIFPTTFSFVWVMLYANTELFLLGSTAWLLLSFLATFAIWTHYYLDLWVVTDRRIILVDQIAFFSRNVSVFRLERMQDIEFKISGIIPTLLNFGTIKAQTAGAHESNFTSTGLPDPRGLQATIQQAMDKRLNTLHATPDQVAKH